MSKLIPLSGRVILEPKREEEKTKSGIVLPDTAEKEKSREGKIIGVASDVKKVKKGDQVLYKEYAGEEVKMNGKDLIILEEKDILAIIK